MRNDHPLDVAFSKLRDATLRRAAAREAASADDTGRITIEIQPPRSSLRPTGKQAKGAALVSVIVGALYGLYEAYTALRAAGAFE